MAMRGLNEAGSGRTGQDEAARPANAGSDPPGSDAPGTDEAARPAKDHSQAPRPGRFSNALGWPRVPVTGSPWRWFFSGIWLVYLIQPVGNLFGHHHGVLWIAGGLAIAIAFCVLYVPTVANSAAGRT